jgi:hypothetical protein
VFIDLLPYLPPDGKFHPATKSLDVIALDVPTQDEHGEWTSALIALVVDKANGKVVLSSPKPDAGLPRNLQKALDQLYTMVEYLVSETIWGQLGVQGFKSRFSEASDIHGKAVARARDIKKFKSSG